jgi:hypothetical protein
MQRIINKKMAKPSRTVSNKALCILTGMIHIAVKVEETAQMYRLTEGNANKVVEVDTNMGVEHSQHNTLPAR